MKSWQKRLEAYSGDVKKSKSEDFTARRLLKGLGWVEAGLPLLCSRLGLEFGPETPRLTVVLDVLDSLSGGWFSTTSPYRRFIVDVRSLPRTKAGFMNADVRAVAAMAANAQVNNGVVVLSKVEDTAGDRCVATVFYNDGGQTSNIPGWLLMPVSVLKARVDGGVSIWVRDAEELVRDMAKVCDWPVPERSGNDYA